MDERLDERLIERSRAGDDVAARTLLERYADLDQAGITPGAALSEYIREVLFAVSRAQSATAVFKALNFSRKGGRPTEFFPLTKEAMCLHVCHAMANDCLSFEAAVEIVASKFDASVGTVARAYKDHKHQYSPRYDKNPED